MRGDARHTSRQSVSLSRGRPDEGERVRAEGEWFRTDGVYWIVDEIERSPDPEPDVLYLVEIVEA
jgi:hypothetical protein